MRALLCGGLLLQLGLVACSAQPLESVEGAAAIAGYRLDYIEPPDGVLAVGIASINEQGTIAGDSLGANGPDAFVWSPTGGFVTLARVETAHFMSAFAINDAGTVAGNAQWDDGRSHPVV